MVGQLQQPTSRTLTSCWSILFAMLSLSFPRSLSQKQILLSYQKLREGSRQQPSAEYKPPFMKVRLS